MNQQWNKVEKLIKKRGVNNINVVHPRRGQSDLSFLPCPRALG
jgi:hypothetical protein